MHPSNSKKNKQLFSPKQNMQDHSKTLAVLQGGWGKEKIFLLQYRQKEYIRKQDLYKAACL